MRILLTGGPVPANLDAVKIVTNKFKGGWMATLANELADLGNKITYLTYKGSVMPKPDSNVTVMFHDGFDDYRKQVPDLCQQNDVAILGAAVANLIPVNPWKGKFPSHDYQAGEIIPIDFTIAPRVIDEVKAKAPHIKLFGFKLLSGVSREELVHAAYETVLSAHTIAVFANDATNLEQVVAVTKERGEHPFSRDQLAKFILELCRDKFYQTVVADGPELDEPDRIALATAIQKGKDIHEEFFPEHNGIVFGTVAVRKDNGFVTTGRGKNELSDFTRVLEVDHETRTVTVANRKATLNAPLLAKLFELDPVVHTIVHGHHIMPDLPVEPYAQPGSVREATRKRKLRSFNMLQHGCYLLFDKEGNLL